MRWIYFLILVVVAMILQTTLVQLLWFRTSLGLVGPELLAAIAVFMALNLRGSTDAALAGWALGFALDLTLTGPTMGLLPILFAAACWGLNRMREAIFKDRAPTQMVLAFLFCAVVYEFWSLVDVWRDGGSIGMRSLQTLLMAAYTGVLAPLVYSALRKIDRLLAAVPTGRGGR